MRFFTHPVTVEQIQSLRDGDIYVCDTTALNERQWPPFEVARAGCKKVLAHFWSRDLAVEYAEWKGDER